MSKKNLDENVSSKLKEQVKNVVKQLEKTNEALIRSRSETKKLKVQLGKEALNLYDKKFNKYLEVEGKKVSARVFVSHATGIEVKLVDEMVAAARAIQSGVDEGLNWKELVKVGRDKRSTDLEAKSNEQVIETKSNQDNLEDEVDDWPEANEENKSFEDESNKNDKIKEAAGQSKKLVQKFKELTSQALQVLEELEQETLPSSTLDKMLKRMAKIRKKLKAIPSTKEEA